MKVQPESISAVKFYLGGNPEKMDAIPDGEGAFEIDLTQSDPYRLARHLDEAANWVRRMQIRYPEDDVDLWVDGEII